MAPCVDSRWLQVQIKDLTVCFVDERAGTRLVLAAELDELRVETADKHWVGKFFDEAIKADEFSLCNLSLCSLLCCGPNKKEYKLVAIHNLRAWWTTEQDLDVSQHQWGTDPSGVFWLLKPFSCKAKANPHTHALYHELLFLPHGPLLVDCCTTSCLTRCIDGSRQPSIGIAATRQLRNVG